MQNAGGVDVWRHRYTQSVAPIPLQRLQKNARETDRPPDRRPAEAETRECLSFGQDGGKRQTTRDASSQLDKVREQVESLES